MRQDILFLEPVFTHNVWGGTRLHDDFGYNVDGDDIDKNKNVRGYSEYIIYSLFNHYFDYIKN